MCGGEAMIHAIFPLSIQKQNEKQTRQDREKKTQSQFLLSEIDLCLSISCPQRYYAQELITNNTVCSLHIPKTKRCTYIIGDRENWWRRKKCCALSSTEEKKSEMIVIRTCASNSKENINQKLFSEHMQCFIIIYVTYPLFIVTIPAMIIQKWNP